MKKILILSGKGGTGKTTVAAAFIRFSHAQALADCDVDAPNLHIITELDVEPQTSEFMGSQRAKIDYDKCAGCGFCSYTCKFEAIKHEKGRYVVDQNACEGCGVCTQVCQEGAITLHDDVAGELSLYSGDRIFSTAELKMGRGNSGKLVAEVKNAMVNAAPDADIAIIDGSPGIGCSVISSVSGVDLVLIVTEPSVSGLSDLERIMKTAEIFQAKAAVCVNRYDVSEEHTAEIEEYCTEHNIPFVGKIPYDSQTSQAINEGISVADVDCPAHTALEEVYKNTMNLL